MTRILTSVPLDPATLGRLETLSGAVVESVPAHEGWWDLPDALASRPEIVLCKFPPRNVRALSKLKFLQLATVGYEHLRHLHLGDLPARICNARGLFDSAIAEWNVAMMTNLARDLRGMIRNQEQARWERAARHQQEVRGATVGLWGYGGIGRETARLAKTLGMTVHVMTRSGVRARRNVYTPPGTGDPEGTLPDRVFAAGQERAFLSELDFLILCLPHTQQSGGLIGAAELRALPRTAFLLNPARGPIVQEAALIKALTEGWIAGAALDTHYVYPLPSDHPLWQFPNVILTPHISGADKSRNFPARIAELFVENVRRCLGGQPLLNELTVAEWGEV